MNLKLILSRHTLFLGLLISFFLIYLFLIPQLSFADVQGVGTPPQGSNGLLPICGADCNFNNLMELANNITRFVFLISIPIASIAFAWAGFLYITAAGNENKIHQAHDIFLKVGIGFFFVLSAWLIVYLITSTLLNTAYRQFLPN